MGANSSAALPTLANQGPPALPESRREINRTQNTMNQKEAKAKTDLQRQIADYESDPRLLDLRKDVALCRVLGEKAHAMIEEKGAELDHATLRLALEVSATTASIIERKSRVDNAHALSAVHVGIIRQAMVRIILAIPENQRERAERELRNSLLAPPEHMELAEFAETNG
jgi:hypothetical protein